MTLRLASSHRARPLAAAGVVVAGLTAALVAAPAVASADQHAPSWISSISWSSTTLAPGVTLRTGTLSDTQSSPFWTVTLQSSTTSRLTGKPAATALGTGAWADTTARALTAAGYTPRRDDVAWPDYADVPGGLQGVRVRTGHYATQAQAAAAVTAIKALGLSAVAEWTGYDVDTSPDGEQIHVATIDPRAFDGNVYATHGGPIASRNKLSAVTAQLQATVGVNAGFFVTADADGYQGAPTGIAAYEGTLESLNNGPRSAVVLGDGPARIARLTATVTVRSGGATEDVNGINRKPGVVRDCGRPGGLPTVEPRQDITCTTGSELVLFTPELGAALPTGDGVQVTLDAHDKVTAVGTRGGTVPAGGTVVQGIGDDATWLADHAVVGKPLQVTEKVRDEDGCNVPLTPHTSIASAAPNLLTDGRIDIPAAGEGVIDPFDLSFNFAWAEVRQPRTMIATDAQGRLLLVTVDGRQPGVSEGLTLVEEAQLLRSLGAVDAMNLDGGGSTAIATNGVLLNKTSDATGERADGDFIVAVPAS